MYQPSVPPACNSLLVCATRRFTHGFNLKFSATTRRANTAPCYVYYACKKVFLTFAEHLAVQGHVLHA